MATLANTGLLDRIIGARAAEAAGTVRAEADEFKLRALPNEDVYFYTKRIDNSRVARAVDPRANSRSWKMIASGCLTAGLLISTLLPSAYGLMAGYKFTALQQERDRLAVVRATLDLEEAGLVSSEHLQELARKQSFADPSPKHVIHIYPKNDGSIALNRR